MADAIEDIEEIGPAYGAKLKACGIKTTDDLLGRCASPKDRAALTAETGLGEKDLLEWANMADLMRIDGVGEQFAELLEASGVDTVKELKNRRADNLTAKMREVNEAKHLTKGNFGEKQVQGWIDQAKALKPILTY